MPDEPHIESAVLIKSRNHIRISMNEERRLNLENFIPALMGNAYAEWAMTVSEPVRMQHLIKKPDTAIAETDDRVAEKYLKHPKNYEKIRRIIKMKKNSNSNIKSTANQELWMQVYDPIEGKYVTRNIIPLMESKNLKGQDEIIAKYMEKTLFSSACSVLDIPEPNVEYSSKNFPSKTTVTIYDSANDTVYVHENSDNTLMLKLFGIAFALRCAWQAKTDSPCLAGYKNRDEIGLEEYNSQKNVVDAMAFGCVIMSLLFSCEPFLDVPTIKADEIKKQKELIYSELILAGKITSEK